MQGSFAFEKGCFSLDRIRVGLIEDHNILRQSLAKAIDMEMDMEVVGQWSNAIEAMEDIRHDPCCDVLIMDLRLPKMNGIEATREIKKLSPNIKIVVLSAYSDDEDVFRSIEAGVVGYLPKEVTVEDLVDAIRTVYRGHAVLSPLITKKVLDRFSKGGASFRSVKGLIPLEVQILKLASEGKSDKDIARLTGINVGGVKFHFREIFRKLGAKNRTQAVAMAIREGLI